MTADLVITNSGQELKDAPFFADEALGERAELGMAPGERSTGEHCGHDGLAEALTALHPIEGLEGLHKAGMEDPPPLLQEAAVGHLVGEGVLEGALGFEKEPRLVEEL